MARIIAVVNQKGGVGKTTTAVNIGAHLAELGQKTLIVDMDPQANATSGVGIDVDKIENTVYELFHGEVSILDVLYPTSVPNLNVIPASPNLAGLSAEVGEKENREFLLKELLGGIEEAYDFILIDCPPSLGVFTINALVAAREILVPVQCEYYALEGLARLIQTLEIVKEKVNPNLKLTGISLTMFDSRTTLSKDVERETRSYFKEQVFQTVIPRNVRISEAPSFGQPITVYAKNSPGAKAYISLAREVLTRG